MNICGENKWDVIIYYKANTVTADELKKLDCI